MLVLLASVLFCSLYPLLFYMSKWEKEQFYKEHKDQYQNGEYKFKNKL